MPSNEQIAKAEQYMKQGEKKLGKWISFGGSKYEDAKDLFEKAANMYKMSKKYQEAANAYERMVHCFTKMGDSRFEAAEAQVNAAHMFKKISKEDAVRSLKEAVQLYINEGKFQMAAKYENEIGELLEDANQLREAITHFESARDYFESESTLTSQLKCIARLGHLRASLGDYDDAIQDFENAAQLSLSDRMLKWGAKDHFFKAGLCRLCRLGEKGAFEEGLEDEKDAIQDYSDQDVTFADTYESKLLQGLLDSIAEMNLTNLTNAIRDYDDLKKLDSWKTSILLKIKKSVEKNLQEPSLV